MSHKGVEKIEALKVVLKELVVAGKKIQADKKVDLQDLPIIIALIPKVPAAIEAFKGLAEAFEEIKDLDVSESIALIQSFHAAIKEIEVA